MQNNRTQNIIKKINNKLNKNGLNLKTVSAFNQKISTILKTNFNVFPQLTMLAELITPATKTFKVVDDKMRDEIRQAKLIIREKKIVKKESKMHLSPRQKRMETIQKKQVKNKQLSEYYCTVEITGDEIYISGEGIVSEYKAQEYTDTFKILARNITECNSKLLQEVHEKWAVIKSDYYEFEMTNLKIIGIVNLSEIKPYNSKTSKMKAATYDDYYFIPEDKRRLENTGYCVLDNFLGTYQPLIKKLTKELFIELCKVENIEDGISSEMLLEVCKHFDISHYSFDMSKKCFFKYVSKNGNYPPLVYYNVDYHMFHITNKDDAFKLICKSKDKVNEFHSREFEEIYEKVNYFDCGYPIYNDLELVDIMELKEHSVIVVKQNKLSALLRLYIHEKKVVPEIKKCNKSDITFFIIKNLEIDYYIFADLNNENQGYNNTIVKVLCKDNNIEFKNQTFHGFISELKTNFYNTKFGRKRFSKKERQLLLDKYKICKHCKCEFEKNKFEIDHIKPISAGGSNEDDNLQLLCVKCHKIKTRNENSNDEYNKNDTFSSFNRQTQDIVNSNLYTSWAFCENLKDIPTRTVQGEGLDEGLDIKQNYEVFHIDVNKCRKNKLYYNKYNIPKFNVMDQVEPYINQTGTGLYYVETEAYFPMRGNGWYNEHTIIICLKDGIINKSNIKYCIISSLIIKKDYFNDFIDFCYSTLGNYKKDAVNVMIGGFAPSQSREQWKHEILTSSLEEAYELFLNNKGIFISTINTKDKLYYNVFSEYVNTNLETEKLIYKFIVEEEALEMYELSKIIKKNNGDVISLNTDCIGCVFKNDIFPFKMLDDINIDGFFFDDEKLIPRYKIEIKVHDVLKSERMKNKKRDEVYICDKKEWQLYNDVDNDDFTPLVNTIINSNSSFNVLGAAGTGKSFLIKELKKVLDTKKIKYNVLGPTNKSAILIGGMTLNKFLNKLNTKDKIDNKVKEYVFIDEVSMMKSVFYKILSVIQYFKPNTKFIITGDFLQYPPINDIVTVDYSECEVLRQLCNSNRLTLTKCRRTNEKKLFEMCKPKNIGAVKSADFPKLICIKNICFTNEKRKEINSILMKRRKEKLENILKKEATRTHKKYMGMASGLIIKKHSLDLYGQDVELFNDMPILCITNNKKLDIVNNEMFKIGNIIADRIYLYNIYYENKIKKIKEINIEVKDFNFNFVIAYCITSHCAQGETYDEPFTIHEWNRFTNTGKYVSLSRASKLEYVNIIDCYKNDKKPEQK